MVRRAWPAPREPRRGCYAPAIEQHIPRADRLTTLAFVGIVFSGGANAVAIRIGLEELPPFWAASLRFGMAAAVLLAALVVLRLPLPKGRARIGVVLYGLTAFAGAYGLIYWGLLEAPAAAVQVIIAMVPLLTLFIAVTLRQERFTIRGTLGALVAFGGVMIIVGDQLAVDVPVASLLAVFVGVCFIAVSTVIVKQIPPGPPVAANAFGMVVGTAALLVLALIAGESLVLPQATATWVTLAYLVAVGSVGLFMLMLYVLARWSASATAYATILMPLVTVVVAAVILGDSIRLAFVAGAALVLVGVYFGISSGRRTDGVAN